MRHCAPSMRARAPARPLVGVLLAVLQYVDERVSDLAGAGQGAAVPAIGPESAAAEGQAIHALGQAHHEPADA